MLKRDELNNPNSCLNNARDDEMIFVLLERDTESMIAAIEAWIKKRIEIGKNQPQDKKLLEARDVIKYLMERL